jgi:hypothetical protein
MRNAIPRPPKDGSPLAQSMTGVASQERAPAPVKTPIRSPATTVRDREVVMTTIMEPSAATGTSCPCGQQTCTHTGYISIPDDTGDSRHMWDRNNPDEVAAARTLFDSMTGKGYRAYRAVGKRGDQGEILAKFDPDAERIIFLKRNVGG